MTRRLVVTLLIIVTSAAFAIALARPALVLGLYTSLISPSPKSTGQPLDGYTVTPVENANDGILDVSKIAFDIPTDTPAEDNEDAENTISGDTPTFQANSQARGENRLIVPAMGVDADVIISDSQSALNKGLWHIPGSALPGEEGNIVISSHRWLYKPPSTRTFYLIDRVKVGDPIYYDYEGKRYNYQVSSVDIVNPEDVHILSQDENKLTLFTCHPLFSTKQRIVISANLISVD